MASEARVVDGPGEESLSQAFFRSRKKCKRRTYLSLDKGKHIFISIDLIARKEDQDELYEIEGWLLEVSTPTIPIRMTYSTRDRSGTILFLGD